MGPRLNLIVLRASDPARLADFYSNLGLTFVRHRHGRGPEHFASEEGGAVFEIYPATDRHEPTRDLRLGFEVSDVVNATNRLSAGGATLLVPPRVSPWGLRSVLEDPEGNKIELTEGNESLGNGLKA